MKINLIGRMRAKKVYYYKHGNGVLKARAMSRFQLASNLLVAMVVLGTGSFGAMKALDFHQARQQKARFQRSGALALDTSKKESESSDKLKDASRQATEDEALAKEIKSKLRNVPGGQKWSVYVRDLNSDRMASINADHVFDAAGLGDLFILPPLESKFTTDKWNWHFSGRTVAECVETMIKSDDDSCNRAINYYANLKEANQVNSSYGFKKTSITEDEQKTSPREIGDLLFRLQSGQVLSDKARRVVFDGLYGQQKREGVPAGCDETCLTANITGEYENLRHDAAIVTSGQAKYVVVIMTSNGASWSQIADVAASIRQSLQP